MSDKKPYQDSAFWFSKLSDAQTCLRKYKLKHIDKVPSGEAKNADLEFGTAMHLAINDVLLGNDGLEIFNIYWDSIGGEEGVQYGRHDHATLKEIAETLLVRFKRLHFKHFEPYQMEERLYAKIGAHAIEGTPDYLGLYKGKRSVVDFKTAGYRYDKRKIACDAQMPGYAALAKEALGYDVEQLVYIVFVKDRTAPSIQVIEKELTSIKSSDMILNMIETCDDLATRKNFPMNTSACIRGPIVCPYFDKCHGEAE